MSNNMIYIGVPRERFHIPEFTDGYERIKISLSRDGRLSGTFEASGHRVDRNRDAIVDAFLKHPGKPEFLLFLDSDMDHPARIGQRLSYWEKDIVGGLYFHRARTADPLALKYAGIDKDKYGRDVRVWEPLRYHVFNFLHRSGIQNVSGSVICEEHLPEHLIEVDAVATGAMMIRRRVLESMPGPWFEYSDPMVSEDLSFCYDMVQKGIKVYCDLGCISGHYVMSPIGSPEFTRSFINRGFNAASVTSELANKIVAFANGISEENASKLINAERYMPPPSPVGRLWKDEYKDNTNEFYALPEVGKAYTLELVSWNRSELFTDLRRSLVGIRDVSVLEIGAGIGTISKQMQYQRNTVVAIEPNEVLRSVIKERDSLVKPSVSGDEMGTLNLIKEIYDIGNSEVFDIVMAFEVFEHMDLDCLKSTIFQCRRLIKPNGRLYFTVNFGQQDLFPMHMDYSKIFDNILRENGFVRISPTEAIAQW